MPLGEDPTGWVIGASRGDIYGQTVTVGSDGRYRFELLTPGPWWVGRMTGHHESTSIRSSKKEVVWSGNCAVKLGKTTKFDLDLRETRRTVINGYWRAGDLDLAAWSVRLRPGELATVDDARDADKATLNSDGEFSVVAPEPGEYMLLIEHTDFPERGVLAVRQLTVHGEELFWSETIRLGELRARFEPGGPITPADLPDTPRLAFIVRRGNGATATALMPSADGVFVSSTAPTGDGDIHYMTPATEELPPIAWPVAATAEVNANETTSLE